MSTNTGSSQGIIRMTTSIRNIVELEELSPTITEMGDLIVEMNEKIVELNFILRQMTLSNLEGDVKTVTIPAGRTIEISHRLKTIPAHRILLRQAGGGLITDGKFTPNYIELNNSGGTDATITIIILKE